ncbi:MAG TPA: glycine--tRNA ligase subunit beta [Chloroflexota bacterium]|nr:glycine--tRNA ligase subunit beta [Chloroflexota bacterium]
MPANTHDVLLEIGVEELPARFCAPALEQLKARAAAALSAARLAHGAIVTLGTPRRLVLLVRDLAARQADRDILSRGPATRIAFDAAGKPTRAAEGFARGQGVSVDALLIQADEKGVAYVYAHRHEAGRSADALLPSLLRDLIDAVEFPQSMRWGTHSMRFARPIRWLLCLLGDRVVPFDVEGIATARDTRGLRALAPGPLPVRSVHDYAGTCAQAYVMVDPAQRRDVIWQQVQAVAAELGGDVPRHDALLEEVTWLVEQPLAFHGSFDPAFLELPADVLVTSMQEHQRYFPVHERDGGRLLPYFIAVRNGLDAHLENVRHGNEKVLRARLADARFFWDEDRRCRLEDRLDTLKAVVFQERLGSQYLRTDRIVWLAEAVADALGYDAATRNKIVRTARLCKCDLVTQMVAEFPELQGVMGREYARAEGEDPLVATGMFEHYLPRGAGDALPGSPTGVAVGLADRLNTLAGFFGLGLIPTGSADPFALRRAAQGVTTVIVERGLRLSLEPLLDAALGGYTLFDEAVRTQAKRELLTFFGARLDGMMKERGFRYDVVDAVLAAGYDDMVDALARADALHSSLSHPQFAAVTGAFKRIANIARQAEPEARSTGRTTRETIAAGVMEPAEAALWQAFTALQAEAEAALNAGDYKRFYALVTRLKQPVDTFFDEVLVMDPDPAVRRRRLAMLRDIAALLTRPADLAKLAVG